MNFIKSIIEAGFIERGQKQLAEAIPHKTNRFSTWWENYPYGQNWYGLSVYAPDAWFMKDGFDAEVLISLQGRLTPYPKSEEDRILMKNMACRYICIMIGAEVIYETFSGKLPPDELIENFINKSITK